MSVVLIVLLGIALLITLAGLVLSPRTPARKPQNEYLVTSKGRRIVESSPVPARSRRTAPAMTAQVAPVRRKAGMLVEGASAGSAPTYQARAGARRASADLARPVRKPARRSSSVRVAPPSPWEALKDRLGTWQVAVPGLITVFLLGLYLLNTAFPYPLIWMPVTFGTSNPPASSAPSNTPVYTASKHLIRLSQLDPAQYRSTQEFNLWAYSACSAASMTEVINSYNHTYKITDILEVEAAIHEITPEEGLLEEVGIQRTGTHFGFKTTWGHNLSLNQVIAAANSGTPVIVSFPPSRYPGGHILVVRGGDSNYVYLADSSRLNWTQISRDRFMQLWAGFYAIMTPA